jgi:hypothetical protein
LVFTQVSMSVHCASVVQVVRHDGLAVLQTNGLHIEVAAAGQAPAPLQFADGVKVLPVQLA